MRAGRLLRGRMWALGFPALSWAGQAGSSGDIGLWCRPNSLANVQRDGRLSALSAGPGASYRSSVGVV